MANITTSVPNLIQGVSQQSPRVRIPGQCEEQLNALPTVTKGLTKRPPARLIKKLTDANVFNKGDMIHFIERSATERYVVVIEHRSQSDRQGVLRAFNVDTGDEATIEGVTGGYNINNNYLQLKATDDTLFPASDSHKLLKARTLGDSTFILNTTKTVAKGTEKSEALDKSRALVFIKQGDYGKKYGLKFREVGRFNDNLGATFNVTWEIERERGSKGGTFYRYRIASVSVNNGGSGYNVNDTPTLDFDGVSWIDRPEIVTTIESGSVLKVDLVHKGVTEEYRFDELPTFPSFVRASPPYEEVFITTLTASSGSVKERAVDSTNIAFELQKALTNSTIGSFADGGSGLRGTSESVATQYSFTAKDGSIIIQRDDGRDFFVEAFDGLNGSGLGLVHKEVDALSDLPVRAPDGFRVAVRGDADANEDDYYLRFESNDGQAFGEGGWVEDVGPDLEVAFDANTLPLQLINTAPNTFTLNTTSWGRREAGDDETNPFPSFVGNTINNMVFFKNRFGFIFQDIIVLSEAAELFNFFRTTVRTLLDTAPIDITSATANVTDLRSSIAFQENLLLFGNRGQFVLKGDPLTNDTVTLNAITNYNSDTTADPLAVGSYVYFPYERGEFLGVQEYSLNATTDVYDSDEITTQIPAYIPKGDVLFAAGTSSEELLAFATGGTDIYLYKYFFNGREKVLSSWGKLTMPFDVIGMHFMKSSLFCVGDKSGQSVISEVKFEELRLEDDTTGGFTVHLDLLKKHTFDQSVVTDAVDITIDLGFVPESGDVVEVYDLDGRKLNIVSINNNTATIQGFYKTCFSGLKYNMECTLSEPVFKQGNPPTSSGLARLILRNGTLFFSDASAFQIEVTPRARDKRVYSYSPLNINVDALGSRASEEGKFRFSIYTAAPESVIKIVNSSAFTANFQSCEYEANVHTRSTRI
jgi:hypothetical protein